MRFFALDALRGICALIVVVFHVEVLGRFYAGRLHGIRFFEHGFLFVDFFFVLSGFVMTCAYFSKISSLNDLVIFVIRRLGRVYPLHLFFLILFIGLEFIKLYAYSNGVNAEYVPFGAENSIGSIFTNILLIQALNVHSVPTWNSPSWSISVEFYTYIVFAIFVILSYMKKWLFLIASTFIAAFGAFMVFKFSKYYIDTTYDFGIFRCLFGFFSGAITYVTIAKVKDKLLAPAWVFFVLEAATCLVCIAFVNTTDATPQSLFAPIVFSFAVAVFSFEKGLISDLLNRRPFQFLGEISYTIYISHAFILILFSRIFRVLLQKIGHVSFVEYHYHDSPRALMVPVSYPFSNAIVVCILLSVVLFCVPVHRWLEIPSRNFFNRVAKRFHPPRSFSRP